MAITLVNSGTDPNVRTLSSQPMTEFTCAWLLPDKDFYYESLVIITIYESLGFIGLSLMHYIEEYSEETLTNGRCYHFNILNKY